MGRKGRDPKQTGADPKPPWKADEPCPCDSGRPYTRCCLGFDGRPYKTPVGRHPPSPETGSSHPRCYMGWTLDCGQEISGEHYISASVLSHLGGLNVKVHGVPWLAVDQTKNLPITSSGRTCFANATTKLWRELDATAKTFFTALKLMHDDIFDKKTLSRRSKWFLLSGEELELWMLKTALGLFHSGIAAKERSSLKAEQTINPECYNILYSSTLPIPCGLYVEPIQISERAEIQWQPASDLGRTRMIILRRRRICLLR